MFSKNHFIFKAKFFRSIISAVLSASGYTKLHQRKMAASVEASWEEVLSCIDHLLMETEIQDSNPELGFHEAALLLNRLEMAVSVLRALVEMECQSSFKIVV